MLRIVWMAGAKPEPEAVLLPPGYDMQVQVRDRLADDIVDQDHRAVGFEAVLYRTLKSLCRQEELLHPVSGQIAQKPDMHSRDKQRMAVEERSVVKERNQALTLVNHRRLRVAPDYSAEDAFLLSWIAPGPGD